MKKKIGMLIAVCCLGMLNVHAEETEVGGRRININFPSMIFLNQEVKLTVDEKYDSLYYQYTTLSNDEMQVVEHLNSIAEEARKLYDAYDDKNVECRDFEIKNGKDSVNYQQCIIEQNNLYQKVVEKNNAYDEQEKKIKQYDDSKWVSIPNGTFQFTMNNVNEKTNVIVWAKVVSGQDTTYDYQIYTFDQIKNTSTTTETKTTSSNEQKKGTVKNPNTGDPIVPISIGFIIISFIGMLSLKRYKKAKNN